MKAHLKLRCPRTVWTPVAVMAACLLCLPSIAAAYPQVGNISFSPAKPWLGDDIGIMADCTDNMSYEITSVLLNMEGGGSILPDMPMARVAANTYVYNLSSSMVQQRGSYTATVSCANNISNLSTGSVSFSVSALTGSISSVDSGYVGQTMTIKFSLQNDGSPVTNYPTMPSFTVKINGVGVPLRGTPPVIYLSSPGLWQLKVDVPSATGDYDVSVYANYSGKVISNNTLVSVQNPMSLSVSNVDKKWVRAGDNVTATVSATYMGQAVAITGSNMDVFLDDGELSASVTAASGSQYYVKFQVPDLPTGAKNISLRFTYLGNITHQSWTAYYTTPVSGSIFGSDGKGTGVSLRFKASGVDTSFYMDSSGQYSGYIPPGIYEVYLSNSRTKLTLSSVSVYSFDDPLKFTYLSSPAVRGLSVSDLYSFGISVPYSTASLELKYDDGSYPNESAIMVFRCSSWNSGTAACSSNWTRQGFDLDTNRNLIKISTTGLATYAIGSEKRLMMSFKAD